MRATLPHPATIADIATGTGIWLFELTHDLPPGNAYVGFDISDTQVPSPGDIAAGFANVDVDVAHGNLSGERPGPDRNTLQFIQHDMKQPSPSHGTADSTS